MDRWDVMALLGIVCLGCGLWLVAPVLALTVGGGALFVVGLGGSIATERAAVRQALIDAKRGGA